jgi:hypothetical protein
MTNIENTGIVTSDTSVATGLRVLYWIAVSAGSTGGAFQINDSTDDSGTDKINLTVAANSTLFIDLSHAPLELKTGLYVDVPGTNVTVNVGYR